MYNQPRNAPNGQVTERRAKRSLTPTFDKLTPEQVEALGDSTVPYPPGVNAEQVLKEASRLWLAQQLDRYGLL